MRIEPLEEKVVLATFAVIGDYGLSGAGEAAVANMVKSWDPELILTLGDNNYESGAASTIDDNIGQYYHDYIGNYQGSYGPGSPTNRFFPVLGNHDLQTPGAEPYFDYFTLPGNERYYDFVVDNVHFFALNSNPQEADGISSTSAQAMWLRDGLATSQETFNIVYFHHTPYTSGSATEVMRWPFQQWGADAVLAGHQHQYERLYVGGLPYFVNGLGGAEITPFGGTSSDSQARYNDDYGAMRLVTSEANLRFEFLSIAGGETLVDSFTLQATGVLNDNLAAATLLEGTDVAAMASNVGASLEPGEPYNIGSTGGKSVWWNWTAPADGLVSVSTAGSDFDTTLGIYSGPTVSSLTKVASNDDAGGSLRTSNLSFVARAGDTYHISVDGYAGAAGNIALQLQWEATLASGSDDFATRSPLAGANVTAVAANANATTQAGEPNNGGVTGGKSLWWSWTAPTTGPVGISTAGSSFDTTLGIYTGSNIQALTPVAANDDERSSLTTSLVSFTAIAGQTYQISVDGYQGAAGQIKLAITANDNFANSIPLTGDNVSLAGSNLGASLQTGEPQNAGVTGGKSVWWSWTAPASGSAMVSTAGSEFDTTLGVYSGSSVESLTEVAADDDVSSALRTSELWFPAVEGTTYHISVDGYKGAAGNIALQLQLEPSPATGNDNFDSRISLVGANLTAAATNTGATTEAGEPANGGVTGGRSLWWSWTAPSTGPVSISTAGSSFDTTLGIYTGNQLQNLTAVAANDDERSSLTTSLVTFAATAGQNYQISVDGYRAAEGQIQLAITANDDFANRIALTGDNLNIAGTSRGASLQTGEPTNAGVAGGSSVWWSWTAPDSGLATVSTAGSSFDTTLGIYRGESLGSLSEIAADDDVSSALRTSELSFAAEQGKTYHISIDGYSGAEGNISWQLQLVAMALSGSDAFSSRSALQGTIATALGTNTEATTEAGEPENGGVTGGRSLWWSYTAPASGQVRISTSGSSFDTTLGVYTGSSLQALQAVAANDDESSSLTTSLVTFSALAGQTYQISVDGYRGAAGYVTLELTLDEGEGEGEAGTDGLEDAFGE